VDAQATPKRLHPLTQSSLQLPDDKAPHLGEPHSIPARVTTYARWLSTGGGTANSGIRFLHADASRQALPPAVCIESQTAATPMSRVYLQSRRLTYCSSANTVRTSRIAPAFAPRPTQESAVPKEFKKFDAEYTKISTKYRTITAANGSAISKRFGIAKASISEGENNLRDCLVTARKNGVTGSTLADFVKDKTAKEGITLLDTATTILKQEMIALDTFAGQAAAAIQELVALEKSIEKDLGKRKDSSESKKDIESLQAQIAADRKEFLKLTKLPDEKVTPFYRNYAKNFQTTLAKIIKEAPEAQAERKHKEEAPQKLQDRNLKKYLSSCVALHKDVASACDQAMEKAGNGDKAGALKLLKDAAVSRDKLHATADEMSKILKEFGEVVTGTKDEKKIREAISKMAKLDEDAERRIRGMATTIKKAG
jgi:hypothetical protein